MSSELHIRISEDAIETPDEILSEFPFEEGQAIVSFQAGLIIVDLGEADDTTYLQDWYLNSYDLVLSFFIVDG